MRALPDPTPRSRARHLAVGLALLAAALILAACGSSDSDTKSGSSATSDTATSDTGTSSSALVVKTASDPSLGTILVDAEGKTLYTLTNGGQAVPCTGACLTAWPPLVLATGTTTAKGGSGVTGLAVVDTSAGTQVTHGDLPLYRFAADAAAGDAKGEGLSSFGGVWHVVKVGGGASSSSSTSTTKGDDGYSGY